MPNFEEMTTEQLRARLELVQKARRNLMVERVTATNKAKLTSKTPLESLKALASGMSEEERKKLKEQLLGAKPQTGG